MTFGALSYLPDYYLKQRMLKEIYNHYDIYENTIYLVAGAVNITMEKIGNALGLSSIVYSKIHFSFLCSPFQPEQQCKSQDAEGNVLAMRETNENPLKGNLKPVPDPVESPSSKMIAQVLLSMNADSAPSFELGIDFENETQPRQEPILFNEAVSTIYDMDNQIQQLRDQFKPLN
ncbi:hypothetical protein PIB30_046641 [Stylosanthes scabra]|uniref:Uncharacterized protein n=1 Tax=Stylosanthes scabra TaxID=79078 RepID=A0ABU6XGT4_9FABA|nr:hypothetical protein [Stylosanthes scabra]